MKKQAVFFAAILAIAGIATPFTLAQAQEGAVPSAGLSTLPDDIVWETNYDDPPIGSAEAIRGGTFNFSMSGYPQTFRVFGPNSNGVFAWWNRAFTIAFGLVSIHPVTENFYPVMATYWSVQEDQRTIYFKLDPDARFSDGEPITADDYVFTWEMLQSEHIVAPFYNSYMERYYESVEKIDDYTLRIVGTEPSWRPLYDYGGLWPTPAHATQLDEDWVTRTNNDWQIAIGPYVVSEVSRGESVTFERIENWWGDGKHYFQGLYNFDSIHLRVIPPDRTLDYMRRGELDLMAEPSSRAWYEEYTFPAVQNGWLRRARVFLQMPEGVGGLHMNLEAPIFQNRDFRIAMQHLLNFDRLNRNLLYGEAIRKVSFFEGTEYRNPNLTTYEFNPVKAAEYLERAGYRRPDNLRGENLIQNVGNVARGLMFTRSDTDATLVNEQGQRASFTVMYGRKALEPALTIIQQDFRRAGIDMRLQLLEPGTAFQRARDRKYEMTLTLWSSGIYPAPRQYLHSENKSTTNTNNQWGFGNEEVDRHIETFEKDMDFENRLNAIHRIDEIVHDEAFYIPFWSAPYIRLVYWDYLQFPEFYLPKRAQNHIDYMVYWIDPEKKAALEAAMRDNVPYEVDEELDKDFYGIREQLQ